ncbi:MAG TPA: cold shock domain-containing protein, partial [Anaerolineae bacterium]
MADDKIIRCAECGVNFLWTVAEQAGDSRPPARCPACRRLAPPPGQRRGLVKWFNRAKGYGFITGTDGAEVFVHKSGLAPDQALPRAGQLVQYALGTGPRGVQAQDVVVLEAPAAAEGDGASA